MSTKEFSEKSTQFWIRKQLRAKEFIWGRSFLENKYVFPCHRLPRERLERERVDRNNKKVIKNINRILTTDLVRKYQLGGVFYNFAIAHFFPFFHQYFNNYIYFEPILQVDLDKRLYRDHLYHQIKVAEVINFLLNDSNMLDDAFLRFIETNYYKQFVNLLPASRYKKSEFITPNPKLKKLHLKALWLSALFHDLGYLFYMYQKIEKKIKDFFPFLGGSCLSDLITALENHQFKKSLISQYLIHAAHLNEENIYEVTAKLANEENHSVASAIQILFLRDQMLLRGLALELEANFIYEVAALLVFTHQKIGSNDYKHNNINFNDNPFACILYIADNIQEWGRFCLEKMSFIEQCESVNVEMSDKILKIGFEIKAEYEKEWKIPSFEMVQGFPLNIENQGVMKRF